MNNNNFNKEKIINAIIASSGGKINRNTAEKAASGNTNALLSSLSTEDRNQLQALLSDKAATQKLLSSDAARQLLKIIGKG